MHAHEYIQSCEYRTEFFYSSFYPFIHWFIFKTLLNEKTFSCTWLYLVVEVSNWKFEGFILWRDDSSFCSWRYCMKTSVWLFLWDFGLWKRSPWDFMFIHTECVVWKDPEEKMSSFSELCMTFSGEWGKGYLQPTYAHRIREVKHNSRVLYLGIWRIISYTLSC